MSADALSAAEAHVNTVADRAVRGIGGALIVVAAVEAALLECFLLPSWIAGVPVPVSIPAAMAGNIVLPVLARRVTGSRVVAALPVLAWLVVVFVAAVPRAEGDLIVTGTLRGMAFLLLGALAGAYGVVRAVTTPSPAPVALDQGALVR